MSIDTVSAATFITKSEIVKTTNAVQIHGRAGRCSSITIKEQRVYPDGRIREEEALVHLDVVVAALRAAGYKVSKKNHVDLGEYVDVGGVKTLVLEH